MVLCGTENFHSSIEAVVINNVEKVLAIELLSAAQALDFRRPAKSSEVVEQLHSSFRKNISFNDADRVLHNDMMKAVEFIRMWIWKD